MKAPSGITFWGYYIGCCIMIAAILGFIEGADIVRCLVVLNIGLILCIITKTLLSKMKCNVDADNLFELIKVIVITITLFIIIKFFLYVTEIAK